jgi:hypothetical protein
LNQNIQDLLRYGVLNPENLNPENEDEVSENEVAFKILSPGNLDQFEKNENLFINLEDINKNIDKFMFYINNHFIETTRTNQIILELDKLSGLKKENILTIKAFGKNPELKSEQEIQFIIK